MQEKYTELQSLVQETKHGNMGKVAAIVTQQQNKVRNDELFYKEHFKEGKTLGKGNLILS